MLGEHWDPERLDRWLRWAEEDTPEDVRNVAAELRWAEERIDGWGGLEVEPLSPAVQAWCAILSSINVEDPEADVAEGDLDAWIDAIGWWSSIYDAGLAVEPADAATRLVEIFSRPIHPGRWRRFFVELKSEADRQGRSADELLEGLIASAVYLAAEESSVPPARDLSDEALRKWLAAAIDFHVSRGLRPHVHEFSPAEERNAAAVEGRRPRRLHRELDDHRLVAEASRRFPVQPGAMEEFVDLERAFSRLPAREADVVRLRFVDGCSHEEIADELGISVSASTSALSRARATLRACM